MEEGEMWRREVGWVKYLSCYLKVWSDLVLFIILLPSLFLFLPPFCLPLLLSTSPSHTHFLCDCVLHAFQETRSAGSCARSASCVLTARADHAHLACRVLRCCCEKCERGEGRGERGEGRGERGEGRGERGEGRGEKVEWRKEGEGEKGHTIDLHNDSAEVIVYQGAVASFALETVRMKVIALKTEEE